MLGLRRAARSDKKHCDAVSTGGQVYQAGTMEVIVKVVHRQHICMRNESCDLGSGKFIGATEARQNFAGLDHYERHSINHIDTTANAICVLRKMQL